MSGARSVRVWDVEAGCSNGGQLLRMGSLAHEVFSTLPISKFPSSRGPCLAVSLPVWGSIGSPVGCSLYLQQTLAE